MTSLVMVALLLVGAAAHKNQAKKFDKLWKAKKLECEQTACLGQVIAEAHNCVNKCTSPKCFEDIFAKNPLEDGEVDLVRSQEFSSCMRKEQRTLGQKKRGQSVEND